MKVEHVIAFYVLTFCFGAMRAELDGGDICRYENGIKAPNLLTFVKIIQCLRVSPAELLDERLWKDDIKPERPKW